VTVMAGRTVTVVATNLFGAGALTVTKTVDGPGAELYGAGPFEVSVSCSYTDNSGQQAPLDTPGGATRTLTAENDYTATYAPLLFGSTCRIDETATGGATSTVITDADGKEISQFTVDSLTDEIRVNVANTFEVGSVRVQKRVVGDGPNRFEVELSCTRDVDGNDIAVVVPGGASRSLARSKDFTARYDALPAGAACTLVETDDGGARETTISPNDGDPEVGVATVGDGTTVNLEVVNEFDAAPQPADDAEDDVADDDEAADEEAADEDDGAGGLLPDTGADRALLALLLLGLGLLGAGGVLVGRGRRGRTL
jgi:large repetitive protein